MAGDSILNRFQKDAVVMFVGTHPDDEHTLGPLLAVAADRCKEVPVVCLTRGESGWNLHKEDLTRTLAEVREAEFVAAVRTLGCEPMLLDYVNGRSRAHPDGLAVQDYEETAIVRWRAPGGRDQTVEETWERWTQQNGDPVARLVKIFQEKQPSVVITFDPGKGYTDHGEHKATARITLKALTEYNRSAKVRAALYYAHNPGGTVEGAERILTETLSKVGGRDYRKVADDAQAFYESQYGSRGSERAAKNLNHWHDQQLLEYAGTP